MPGANPVFGRPGPPTEWRLINAVQLGRVRRNPGVPVDVFREIKHHATHQLAGNSLVAVSAERNAAIRSGIIETGIRGTGPAPYATHVKFVQEHDWILVSER